MATFHDRTIAPRVQRGLLRTGGVPCPVLTDAEVIALTADAPALPVPFAFRLSPPVADPRSPDELLAEIAAEIERQEVSIQIEPKSELPPEPLLAADVPRDVARAHMCTTEDTGSANRCSTSTVCPAAEQNSELADVPHGGAGCADISTPSTARTLHLRRQLAQAAEHGVALLAPSAFPAS